MFQAFSHKRLKIAAFESTGLSDLVECIFWQVTARLSFMPSFCDLFFTASPLSVSAVVP
jgi:hypothetical protein